MEFLNKITSRYEQECSELKLRAEKKRERRNKSRKALYNKYRSLKDRTSRAQSFIFLSVVN